MVETVDDIQISVAATGEARPATTHLFRQWREFIAALSFRTGCFDPPSSSAANLPDREAVGHIAEQLAVLLERQRAEASLDAQRVPGEAQYAMAAFADERLSGRSWAGDGFWPQNRLEVQLFESRGADREIFRRIDALLETPPGTLRDMARIYLAMLALGFEGRYRGRKDRSGLLRARERLHAYAAGRSPDSWRSEAGPLPDCYRHRVAASEPGDLPMPRRWAAVLIVIVAVYIAISFGLWRWLTLAAATQLGPGL